MHFNKEVAHQNSLEEILSDKLQPQTFLQSQNNFT